MTDIDLESSFQNARIRNAADTSRSAVGRAMAKSSIGNAVLQQLFYEDPAPKPGNVQLLLSFRLPDDVYAHGVTPDQVKEQLLKWSDEKLGVAGAKGTVIDKVEEGTRHMHVALRGSMTGRAMGLANAPHTHFVVKYELPDSHAASQACESLNQQFGKKPALGRA